MSNEEYTLNYPVNVSTLLDFLNVVKNFTIKEIIHNDDNHVVLRLASFGPRQPKNSVINHYKLIELIPYKIYKSEDRIIILNHQKIADLNESYYNDLLKDFIPTYCPELDLFIRDNWTYIQYCPYNIYIPINPTTAALTCEILMTQYNALINNELKIPDYIHKCCVLGTLSSYFYNQPLRNDIFIDLRYVNNIIQSSTDLKFNDFCEEFLNNYNSSTQEYYPIRGLHQLTTDPEEIINFLDGNILCAAGSLKLYEKMVDLQLLSYFNSQIMNKE